MNHLLRGKKALTSKTKRVVPHGVIPPVMKPKKKAERKLSDSSSNRPLPQHSQQSLKPRISTQGSTHHHHTLKRPPHGSDGPPKVETLHWKDTPRRDRRASLPSGVKFLENSSTSSSLGVLGVAEEMDDEGENGSSTSTELCDDDEDDKLSDLEADTGFEPRPATTSPRLETVKEGRTASPDPSKVKAAKAKAVKEPKESVVAQAKAKIKENKEAKETREAKETKEAAVTETEVSVPEDIKGSVLPGVEGSKESVLVNGKESVLEKIKETVSDVAKESVSEAAKESESVVVVLADTEDGVFEEGKKSVQADDKVSVLADDEPGVLPATKVSVVMDVIDSVLAKDVISAEDQNIQQVSYPITTSPLTTTTLDTQGPELPNPPASTLLTTFDVDAQTGTDNQNSQAVPQGYPPKDQLPSANQDVLETMTPVTIPRVGEDTVQSPPTTQVPAKDQETEDAPLWDLKSGIPLEDLLAKKNLTAAEIIARIPFPSDVSFMKDSQDTASKISRNISLRRTEGAGSPFSTLHNVTPERSPIDSPVLRMSSDSLLHDVIRTPPSTSPSKSPTTFSTPSPRDSPILRHSKSPVLSPTDTQGPKESLKWPLVGIPSPATSRSPASSPTDTQAPSGPPSWSLAGLPPINSSDILQEPSLIPPKSPKITVEDDKRNIFEIYEGYSGRLGYEEDLKDIAEEEILEVSDVKEGIFKVKTVNEESLEKGIKEENFETKLEILPEISEMNEDDFVNRHVIHASLSLDQLRSTSDRKSDMSASESDTNLEERIRELFGQVAAQMSEGSECPVDGPIDAVNRDAVKGSTEDVNKDGVIDVTKAVNIDVLGPIDAVSRDAVKGPIEAVDRDAVHDAEARREEAVQEMLKNECSTSGEVQAQRLTNLLNDSEFEPRTADEKQTGAPFLEALTSKSGYLCLSKPAGETESEERKSERETPDQNKVFSITSVLESPVIGRVSEVVLGTSSIPESLKAEQEGKVILETDAHEVKKVSEEVIPGTPTTPDSLKLKEEWEVILGTSSLESPLDAKTELALGTPTTQYQGDSLEKETDLLLETPIATTESQIDKEKQQILGTPEHHVYNTMFTSGEETELLLGTLSTNNESSVEGLSHSLSGTSSWLSVMCMSVCKDTNTSPSHVRPIFANTIISEHQNRVVRISPHEEMLPFSSSVFTTTTTTTTTITTTTPDSIHISTPEDQSYKITTQVSSPSESVNLIGLSTAPCETLSKVSEASQDLLPSESIAEPSDLVGLNSVPCVSPSKVSTTSPELLPSSLSPLYPEERLPEIQSVSLQGDGLAGLRKQIKAGLSISPVEREDVVPLFTVDDGKSFKGFDLVTLASEEPQSLFKGFDLSSLSTEEPQSILVSLASEEPQSLFKGFNLTSISSEEPQSLFKGFNLTTLSSEEPQSLFKGFNLTSMSNEEPQSLFKGFNLTSLANEEPQSLLASLANEESQSIFTNDKMTSIKFSVLDQILTSETIANGPPGTSSSSSLSSSSSSSFFSTVLSQMLSSETLANGPPATSAPFSSYSTAAMANGPPVTLSTFSSSFSPSSFSSPLPNGPSVTTSTSFTTSSFSSSIPTCFSLATISPLKTTPTTNTSVTFSLLNNPDLRCSLAASDLTASLPAASYPSDQSATSDTQAEVKSRENGEAIAAETCRSESVEENKGGSVKDNSSVSSELSDATNLDTQIKMDTQESGQPPQTEAGSSESRKESSGISISGSSSRKDSSNRYSGFSNFKGEKGQPTPSLSLEERISAILGASTNMPSLEAQCDSNVSEEPMKEEKKKKEEEEKKGDASSWKQTAAQQVKEKEENEEKEKERKETEKGLKDEEVKREKEIKDDEKEEKKTEKTEGMEEKEEKREKEMEFEEKEEETKIQKEGKKEDRVKEEKERDETEEKEEEEEEKKEEENKRSSSRSNIDPFAVQKERKKEEEEEEEEKTEVNQREIINKNNIQSLATNKEEEEKKEKKEEEEEKKEKKPITSTSTTTTTTTTTSTTTTTTTKTTTTTTTTNTFTVPNWEDDHSSYPIIPLERESSLSASLEGRLSLFTRYEEEEEEEEEEEDDEDEEVEDEGEEKSEAKIKYSEEQDHEAENETDFFNGKDLSSEAIRQRLWRGVKSLSLDADVSLDPDLFCFLIEQSSKHCRRTTKGGDQLRRSMPKRRNSEVALQELVKENTEIIERILKQKSLESSTPLRNDLDDREEREERERHSGLSTFIKLLRERSESERSPESDSHRTSPLMDPPQSTRTTTTTTTTTTTSANTKASSSSSSSASSSSSSSTTTTDTNKTIKPSSSSSSASSSSSSSSSSSKPSKQLSPLLLKAFTPERKSASRKEESPTVQSPSSTTKKEDHFATPSPIRSPTQSVSRKEGISPTQSVSKREILSPSESMKPAYKRESNVPALSPPSPTKTDAKGEVLHLSPTHPISKKGDLSPTQSKATLSPASPAKSTTKKEGVSPTTPKPKEVLSPTPPMSKNEVLSSPQLSSAPCKTENKLALGPLSPTQPKTNFKREDSVSSVLSPVSPRQPIPFNPFPTRNVQRQPKEITVKLGLYSPSKKTKTSS